MSRISLFFFVSVDCNDPAVPDNGMIDLPSGTTVGSPVMYNCSSGYVLNGDMTRWCLTSGEWSGKTPTCDPIGKCIYVYVYVCITLKPIHNK